jgi:hypothetical protein
VNFRTIARNLLAPVTILCRPLRQGWQNLRYQMLAKTNRLPLYQLSISETIGRQIAFADIYEQQQKTFSWIPRPHYFIGGSADPAFLSILIRALTENKFNCIIEFGAGQTSRVLSAWSAETGGKVFTIDHDPDWVEKSRHSVLSKLHRIVHAPLQAGPLGQWYDLASFTEQFPETRADLIIVDGPVGTRRWSRAGIIAEFPMLSRPECVVLWDDLDRFGDLESFAGLVRSLRTHEITFDVRFCQAYRTLGLLFTPQYSGLRYYC